MDLEDIAKVASPCRVPWSSMSGDDKIKHCRQCKLDVYNLSSMSKDKALDFLAAAEGKERTCISFYRRSDGTIITRDCPQGAARMRTMVYGLLRMIAGLVSVLLAIGPASAEEKDRFRNGLPLIRLDSFVLSATGVEHVYGEAVPGSSDLAGATPVRADWLLPDGVSIDEKDAVTVKFPAAGGKHTARETRIEKDRVEEILYRGDGTLWTRRVRSGSSHQVDYFDVSGCLRVHRDFTPSGEMKVDIYHADGRVAYTQHWSRGGSGYILYKVEEPLPGSRVRRLFLSGDQVDHCDYLNSEGTVSWTERGEMLSSPVDASHLTEYSLDDDPSVPKSDYP